MTTTTVIGDVIKKISGPVNRPPPAPPGRPPSGGGGKKGGGGGIGASAFETAIGTESPLVWYTFRDNHFNQRVRDRAGSRHLAKQIAAATRSSVPTRTTHPGGILFDAIDAADWANDGQFYKGPTGVLNGASAYTWLISVRMLSRKASNQTLFGIGTEGTVLSGDNYLLGLSDASGAPVGVKIVHRTTGFGSLIMDPTITGRTEDGVNRLFTIRSTGSSSQILKISKPGATYVTEDTATLGDLAAINRALLLNAQDDTVQDSPSFVIDQIALWDSDIGATAEENLHDLWTAELGGYYPSMMQFDGSAYYSNTYTSSGNKVTAVIRFNRATFGGDTVERLVDIRGPGGQVRLLLSVFSSASTQTSKQGKFQANVTNSAGTQICLLISSSTVIDGEDHLCFFSFDADAGTALLYIDGIDEDDTGNASRVAPTTGTLDTGASTVALVGLQSGLGNPFTGNIGLLGVRDGYLTNPEDFGTGPLPAAIDEVNWTEWGAQPLFWSHSGEMTNTKGSAGDMTANGTITMTEGGSP